MQLARREAESPDLQVGIVEERSLPADPGLEAMFCDFYRRIHDRALDHAQRFLSPGEAEDAVTDAFGEVWSRWKKLLPEQRSDAFFFATIHHKVINRLRANASQETLDDADAELTQLAIREIDTPTRATTAADIVDRVVHRMPKERRQVFILVREQGFTYKEVAEILGISESTVNSQITRANANLRAAFEAKGFRLGSGSPPMLPPETKEGPND
jgi:RNA polymerase sigma factor (sigma-70 family)